MRDKLLLGEDLSETVTGLIGEYICLASILERGWKAAHCPQDKVDVICWSGEGQYLRVQVKSSHINTEGGRRAPNYHFQNGSGSAKKKLPTIQTYDVLAHVAINHRKVVFYPVESVNQFSKRYNTQFFEKEDIEHLSWSKTLHVINDRSGRRN